MFSDMPRPNSGGGMGEPVLLWTNPSTTGVFAPQTVSLDLSGYSAVGIKFRDTQDAMFTFMKGFAQDGLYVPCAAGHYGNTERTRAVLGVTDSGVEFGNSWQNGTAYNDNMPPLYIYGIK